jgi:hypothetical protein
VRELAEKADPFNKRRLIDLAEHYERCLRSGSDDRAFANRSKAKPEREALPPVSEPSH